MKRESPVDQVSKTLQLALTVAGLLITLLNVWISSKLAPVAKDLAVLSQRVDAANLEHHNFASRDEVNDIKEDVREIKQDVKALLQRR